MLTFIELDEPSSLSPKLRTLYQVNDIHINSFILALNVTEKPTQFSTHSLHSSNEKLLKKCQFKAQFLSINISVMSRAVIQPRMITLQSEASLSVTAGNL